MKREEQVAVGRARVTWLTPENGGAARIGGKYVFRAPARFGPPVEAGGADEANFTLFVACAELLGAKTWLANVWFATPYAPPDSISPEVQFQLFEGRRCIAQGVVLSVEKRSRPSTTNEPGPGRCDEPGAPA